jgi:hypothetical protein
MEFTPDSAKQFLLSRLGEQAGHDGMALDEVERRMFLFSEAGGRPDFEASEKFDSDYDAKAYESKVAKLLRRAYAHDKQSDDGKALWKAALKALSREDFYGLVMVDQAKIPRVDEGLRVFLLGMLPLALSEIGLLGLGCVLVFQPFRLGLHLPDWFRLLLLPLFFWFFWYVGKIFGRKEVAKSAKQAGSSQG